MSKNKSVILDGKIVDDLWTLIPEDSETEASTLPSGNIIVPLSLWLNKSSLQERSDVGVWLANDIDLTSIEADLSNLPLIAIDFPGFMDGRGFSLARLIRERYQFKGEVRAIGHIIRDQLCYLKRCGFNAFSFGENVDIESALSSLNDFTEAYQVSVDQPIPLFRRRA
jgi:uncharacterized protein (DUF934 family)